VDSPAELLLYKSDFAANGYINSSNLRKSVCLVEGGVERRMPLAAVGSRVQPAPLIPIGTAQGTGKLPPIGKPTGGGTVLVFRQDFAALLPLSFPRLSVRSSCMRDHWHSSRVLTLLLPVDTVNHVVHNTAKVAVVVEPRLVPVMLEAVWM
jgi:hypothetical protein